MLQTKVMCHEENCFSKLPEMARKLIKFDFRIMCPNSPPRKKIWRGGGVKKMLVKNEKKIKVVLNCLKWQEDCSKYLFGILAPPPKKWVGVHNYWSEITKNQMLYVPIFN